MGYEKKTSRLKGVTLVIAVSLCVIVIFITVSTRTKGELQRKNYDEINYGPREQQSVVQTISQTNTPIKVKTLQPMRIVIIGAGPTALGVLYRLYDLGYDSLPNIQIIVLEQGKDVGGAASSYRDKHGFLWDNGGHIMTSRSQYFTNVMDSVVLEWNKVYDNSYVFMMGKDQKRRFIPYPIEASLPYMDEKSQKDSLKGLVKALKQHNNSPTTNYDEWLLGQYGEGLYNIFLRKYNSKAWTVNITQMSKAWIETKPHPINIQKIQQDIRTHKSRNEPSHHDNRYFLFPKHSGTGGTWKGVASNLPEAWFHHGYKMAGLDVDRKTMQVQLTSSRNKMVKPLKYDVLINTGPLDLLINMTSVNNQHARVLKQSADSALIHSHAHIIGIGLKGQPPSILQHKSWIYFPDSDSPFHRAVLFSSYSDDNVPDEQIDKYWSLLCEALQPAGSTNTSRHWSKDGLIEDTIKVLEAYGYITRDKVISKYYYRTEYGRPIPTLNRDAVLKEVQPWLESKSIYSRGLFGGWKYEVGNQDQSFMQGVELVDRLIFGIPETIYSNSTQYTSTDRPREPLSTLTVSNGSKALEYELVLSHYKEDLSHWLPYANWSTIYHKGSNKMPDFRFHKWKNLPNVGRECHSMLYHIISNYDSSLANVTMFFQASTSGSEKRKCYTNDPLKYVNDTLINGFKTKARPATLTSFRIPQTNHYRRLMVPSKMTFEQYWKYVFGTTDMPRVIKWTPCSCFGVSRERIQSRPKSFYERMLKTLSHNSNPQEGHYGERMWYSIFSNLST